MKLPKPLKLPFSITKSEKSPTESGRRKSASFAVSDNYKAAAALLLQQLIIPVTALYMEIISKLQIFEEVFDGTFIYMLPLAAAMGFFIGAFPLLLTGKHRRRVMTGILAAMAVLFSFHAIYCNSFHTFYSWNNLGEAGGATQFWREALISAGGVWYMLAAFLAPPVLFGIFGKKLIPDDGEKSVVFSVAALIISLGLYLPMLGVIYSYQDDESENTPYYNYTYIQNNLDQTFRSFGILNATRLDVKQMLFGAPVEEIDLDGISDLSGIVSDSSLTSSDDETDYGWNKMDIDFDSLEQNLRYAKLDEYYKSVTPTRKNKYTGIFKGKNLILLTLESFCPHVIDPEFTPLLYKMSSEGFHFTKFYNPMWGGSTASGEYAVLTGNYHPNTNCIKLSAGTYQPFTLGNQFSKIGYKTLAYHNYTGYYYNRDESHPNFGYEFKSLDSGLEMATTSWPSSDKEMADATIGDYAGLKTPFHVYYMTMSGHMMYNTTSNEMAQRHIDELPSKYDNADSEVRAYLACQYEVELMLKVIVDELEKNGNLENTVFAMAADHYPYGMKGVGLSELYGLEFGHIRTNMELYHNSFILWTPSMTEPITIDTPCSSVDILPTLSNMFGLEYDSRIMMGTDIMAPGEHIAPVKMSLWSWVSTQGKNNRSMNGFVPNSSCTLSREEQQQYVDRMNKLINAKTTFSKLILDRDYYRHVFNKPKNAQ